MTSDTARPLIRLRLQQEATANELPAAAMPRKNQNHVEIFFYIYLQDRTKSGHEMNFFVYLWCLNVRALFDLLY